MKKIILLIMFVALGFSSLSAGDNFKADSAKIKKQVSVIMKRYYRSVVKAKTANQFAAAIDRYTSDFKKLIPKIKAFEKKYKGRKPAIEGEGYSYNEFDREMQGMMNDEKFAKAMQNHIQFYSHPKVQAAMRRMMQMMAQFGVQEQGGAKQ